MRTRALLGAIACAGGFGLTLVACGAGSAAPAEGALDGSGTDGGLTGSGGASQAGNFGTGGSTPPLIDGGSGGTPPLPPETEEPSAFRPPVVSGRFLWSTNPDSGRVALIDAVSLSTRVISAGLHPTYLAAIPSEPDLPTAIVLNTGNATATLLRATDVAVETAEVPTHPGANAWAVAPSGDFAAAFSLGTATLDPTQGLQDVTLIDLRSDVIERRQLTAGYRPTQVLFDELEESLIVVSEQGISTFELNGDGQHFVPLSGTMLDVSVTRDGHHALVHAESSDTIEIVALDPELPSVTMTLPAPITDLDLAPTGRAVAVLRDLSEIIVFDVDQVLVDPDDYATKIIDGETVGSVELTIDGERAVLFTTAEDNDRLSIVDTSLVDLPVRTVDTETAIASVRTSPDGLHAIALAKPSVGTSTGAFTVVALADERFPRIVGTKAPVLDASLDDTAGVVTTSSAGGVHEAYVISMPSLNVEAMRLASPPVSSGVLAEEGLGFVSQSHASGRVSFFDLLATEIRTLTGFELSAEVVDDQ